MAGRSVAARTRICFLCLGTGRDGANKRNCEQLSSSCFFFFDRSVGRSVGRLVSCRDVKHQNARKTNHCESKKTPRLTRCACGLFFPLYYQWQSGGRERPDHEDMGGRGFGGIPRKKKRGSRDLAAHPARMQGEGLNVSRGALGQCVLSGTYTRVCVSLGVIFGRGNWQV